jgi:N-acetylmuramoyl-L-alanine amidase
VHCAATGPKQDIGAAEIRQWHKAQGWRDIGYHWVIRRDGKVETGRDERTVGAHCSKQGMNNVSIGVCLVGGAVQGNPNKAEQNFSEAQYVALLKILKEIQGRWGELKINGHRDFDPGKACPSFDVQKFLKDRAKPAPKTVPKAAPVAVEPQAGTCVS